MIGAAHIRFNENTQDIKAYFQSDDGVKKRNFNPYEEDEHTAELKKLSGKYHFKFKKTNRSKSKKFH